MHNHAGFPLSLLLIYSTLIALWLIYLAAALQQRGTYRGWSGWRITSFTVGIALILLALSPVVAHLAHQDLRAHMVQHLLLGMLAPLGLVFGAPVTLMLRRLPKRRRRPVALWLQWRPVRFVSLPITALVLDMGGMYLLYLTPLYALSLTNSFVHVLVHWHFLAAGYLFTWSIAGPDPAPHRPSMRTRLIILLLGMAAHATLGKLMYAYHWPRGTGHPPEIIEAAAQIMYYGGDIVELLLAAGLFAGWYRARVKPRFARPLTPVSSRALRQEPG